MPLEFPCFRIACFEITRPVKIVPADPRNDVILDHHRGDRSVVHLIEIADLLIPELLTVLQIQRDKIAIGRFKKGRIAGNAHASISQVNASL